MLTLMERVHVRQEKIRLRHRRWSGLETSLGGGGADQEVWHPYQAREVIYGMLDPPVPGQIHHPLIEDTQQMFKV